MPRKQTLGIQRHTIMQHCIYHYLYYSFCIMIGVFQTFILQS